MNISLRFFLIFFLCVSLPIVSHAKGDGRNIHSVQATNKRVKPPKGPPPQPKSAVHNKLFESCPTQCLRFNRTNVSIAALLFLAVALSVSDLSAKPAPLTSQLPYSFKTEESLSPYAPYQELPQPFRVEPKTALIEQLPCLLPTQNYDTNVVESVVHPGIIQTTLASNSLKEAGAKKYAQSSKAGKCRVENTEIVCRVALDDIVVLDGKREKITEFSEKELAAEAWRFMKAAFLDPAHTTKADPAKIFLGTDYESFRRNLGTLNSIFVTGEHKPSPFFVSENFIYFMTLNNLFSFDAIDTWQTTIATQKPELMDSYQELIDVVDNLNQHIHTAYSALYHRYQELHQMEALDARNKMVLTFKLASFNGLFESNRFLKENFAYIPNYSAATYDNLLKHLRVTTLELYETDPIKAASFFLTRLVQIRPFMKGNGRVARAIANLLLLSDGQAPVVFLSNEQYLKSCRDSFSTTYFLPADVDFFSGNYNRPNVAPFEHFLRATMMKQANNPTIADIFKRLKNCKEGCQAIVDEYVNQ
jgi:fido (protein-threonine AMPylation protein)